MTIADARCFRYTLPFGEPVSVGERTLSERRGLLLCLDGEDGATGWGEAAPLPGFGEETFEKAARCLRTQAEEVGGTELLGSVIDDALRRQSNAENPPSVRFAVASALVELWASARQTSIPSVLGGGADTVALNALIPDGTTDLAEEAERLTASGFRTVKMKVGRRSVSADARRVRRLSVAVGDDIDLRLDANRAWTYESAVAFFEKIEDVPLEYVEEPLRDPDRLGELSGETGRPVALDETTREREPSTLADASHVAAVVLKPTLLGGIRTVRRWVVYALNAGATPVFSASYESGVGTRMLVALASVFGEGAAGLSTYTRLAEDVLSPRLSLEGGEASVEEGFSASVNRARLSGLDSIG